MEQQLVGGGGKREDWIWEEHGPVGQRVEERGREDAGRERGRGAAGTGRGGGGGSKGNKELIERTVEKHGNEAGRCEGSEGER